MGLQLYYKETKHRCCHVKFAKFLRTPPVAASEKQIAEEVQNFPCLYDKGKMATKKKIVKRMHGLGWRMAVAMTNVHELNYKGNLDWLKRYFEKF